MQGSAFERYALVRAWRCRVSPVYVRTLSASRLLSPGKLAGSLGSSAEVNVLAVTRPLGGATIPFCGKVDHSFEITLWGFRTSNRRTRKTFGSTGSTSPL